MQYVVGVVNHLLSLNACDSVQIITVEVLNFKKGKLATDFL